jgi:S1-C subfamily serine protease
MRGLRTAGIVLGIIVLAAVAAVLAPVVYGQVVVRPRVGQGTVQARPRQERAIVQMLLGGHQIGVDIRDLQPSDKSKAESGAVVTNVVKDSPAEKAGVKDGDVITEFDGERVRSAAQFQRLVREQAPGRAAKLVVMRDGKRVDLSVTPQEGTGMGPDTGALAGRLDEMRSLQLDEEQMRTLQERLRQMEERLNEYLRNRQFNFRVEPQDPQQYRFWNNPPPNPEPPNPQNPRWPFSPPPNTPRGQLGVTIQDLTPQLAEYFGVKEGVLISGVQDNSPAEKAGVKAGDVVTSIDGVPVRDRTDLTRDLQRGRSDRTVSLGITRDHKSMTLKVKLDNGWRVVPLHG